MPKPLSALIVALLLGGCVGTNPSYHFDGGHADLSGVGACGLFACGLGCCVNDACLANGKDCVASLVCHQGACDSCGKKDELCCESGCGAGLNQVRDAAGDCRCN